MDIMNRKNVTLIMGIMIRNTKLVGNCKCMDLITTLEECDIPKIPSMAKTEMKKIGFVISA